MTLALLNTLKDIGIGLAAVGMVAFLLWLEARSERTNTERIEAEDLRSMHAHLRSLYVRDWAWPPKWHPPTSEYVARPKARTR